MKIIAHRGNITGPNKDQENHPDYIDKALNLGYDVEIDLRIKDNILYLGHDTPDYKIDIDFIKDRQDKLWIHCKDIESLIFCNCYLSDCNYFWHQEDDYTLTSKGYIWAYPSKKIYSNKSVCVLPEVDDTYAYMCYAVCSDYCHW